MLDVCDNQIKRQHPGGDDDVTTNLSSHQALIRSTLQYGKVYCTTYLDYFFTLEPFCHSRLQTGSFRPGKTTSFLMNLCPFLAHMIMQFSNEPVAETRFSV